MPHCVNCSAPLPADTPRCNYCGTRNDLDFAAVNPFATGREESARTCPECTLPLQTVRFDFDAPLSIERCARCYGLFFDPGEVQAFLASAVAAPLETRLQALVNINRERGARARPVRYLKCPVCSKHMHRVNFAYLSGVVMDQCREHGIWLDNGEIVHLMEWKKAGGELLAERRRLEREREGRRSAPAALPIDLGSYEMTEERGHSDLLETAAALIARLFR